MQAEAELEDAKEGRQECFGCKHMLLGAGLSGRLHLVSTLATLYTALMQPCCYSSHADLQLRLSILFHPQSGQRDQKDQEAGFSIPMLPELASWGYHHQTADAVSTWKSPKGGAIYTLLASEGQCTC